MGVGKLPLLVLAGSVISACAHAQDFSGLTGTISMQADTLYRAGNMAACSLNYRAAVQDQTYRLGALVAVMGSFSLNLVTSNQQRTLAPLLKVGLEQVMPKASGKPEAPTFAYLQSVNGTTAKSVLANDLSETPGYRLFALSLDQPVAGLISDILKGLPIALYYNSSKNGLDVQVPFDIHVVDSKPTSNGLEPIRSEDSLIKFRACVDKLMAEIK